MHWHTAPESPSLFIEALRRVKGGIHDAAINHICFVWKRDNRSDSEWQTYRFKREDCAVNEAGILSRCASKISSFRTRHLRPEKKCLWKSKKSLNISTKLHLIREKGSVKCWPYLLICLEMGLEILPRANEDEATVGCRTFAFAVSLSGRKWRRTGESVTKSITSFV